MKPAAADELSGSSQSGDPTVRAAETVKGCSCMEEEKSSGRWGFSAGRKQRHLEAEAAALGSDRTFQSWGLILPLGEVPLDSTSVVCF